MTSKLTTDDCFPCLDMKMCWNINNKLSFGVCIKLNQQFKYLNIDSSHDTHCFRATKKGVGGGFAMSNCSQILLVKMQARLSCKGQATLYDGRTLVCLARRSHDMINICGVNQPTKGQ